MWDLIVSVPDHCLSFYFPKARVPRARAGICEGGDARRGQEKAGLPEPPQTALSHLSSTQTSKP